MQACKFVVCRPSLVLALIHCSTPQAGANAEVIKRWTNEVQEAINSRHPMVSRRTAHL